MRRIRLSYEKPLAPGDYVVTTALLRDVQIQHPGKFEVCFASPFPELYAHNPNYTHLPAGATGVEEYTVCYQDGIKSSRAGNNHHFLTWFYREFKRVTGVHVDCLYPTPDLHLSPEHLEKAPISGRYWVVFGGGKSDFTVKHWPHLRYQRVVTDLRARHLRFVQTGSTSPGHTHPVIDGALDIVGWGGLTELMWQIYHAEGVICPITVGMHMAAAFGKPCVVVAGGREEPWWEAYDNNWDQFGQRCRKIRMPHQFLHTINALECCQQSGCWANKVVATEGDQNACTNLAERPPGVRQLPTCMDNILVSHVKTAVWDYYVGGKLSSPPIYPIEPELLVDNPVWMPMSRQNC